MSKALLISAASAVFFGVVSMSGAPALAATSACKGIPKAQCDSAAACSWVKSYKNKSGKNVSAHCRAKSKGSSKVKGKLPAKPKTN